jgi:hypothetical protein
MRYLTTTVLSRPAADEPEWEAEWIDLGGEG